MKNLLLVCLLSVSLVFGACAHKSGGCKDGSCKMEQKDCGCGKDSADAKKADDKK